MKYIINHTEEGKILGFVKGDTDLNIEVSNSIWFKGQSYNKIIIDGDNISFDKIDWRTADEIEKERISSIKAKAQGLILEKYPLEKQSSANLGLYGQEYLDNMKAYILNIITISNEAELNGTSLEDIVWN